MQRIFEVPTAAEELTAPKDRETGKKPAKTQAAMTRDRDLLDRLRALGPGWRTRVDAALRRLVEP